MRTLGMLPNGDLIAGTAIYFSPVPPPFSSLRARLARWDGTNLSAVGGDLNNTVHALSVLPNGDVVIGGQFSAADNLTVPLARVARWDGVAWNYMDGGMDSGGVFLPGSVSELLFTSSGELVIGGSFREAGPLAARMMARRVSDCPAAALSLPAGCAAPNGDDTLSVTSGAWLGSEARYELTLAAAPAAAVAVTGFARLDPGLSLDTVFSQATPGCQLHAATSFADLLTIDSGSAVSTVPIPAAASLIGQVYWHQAVTFALGTLGIADVTAANAIESTIGAF